jgi:hypothetical protein
MFKLNLSKKIKDLQYVHIVELIWIDPITCARYYNYNFFSQNYDKKPLSLRAYIYNLLLLLFFIEFHNCVNEYAHGLLLIKDASMYGMHTNEKNEQFINIYISMMYHVTKSSAKCTTTT